MSFVIQVIVDGLSLGSFYALAALGIGLLFGVLKLINFAHGDFITVGAYALIIPSAATQATLFIGTGASLDLGTGQVELPDPDALDPADVGFSVENGIKRVSIDRCFHSCTTAETS